MLGRLKEAIPYAALLAGAAFLYWDSSRFASLGRAGQLSPAFWPRAVLALLMGVCAWELARRVLFAPPRPRAEARPAQDEGEAARARRHPLLLAAGIGLTVAYVLLLGILGFFLATAFYLAGFMLVGRYRRAGVIAASSVLGSLAFIFVFMKIVYVSLPLGVGPFERLSIWILAALGVH
ncbi:MAG TPA: tripartite tricarboxylate transporter TctB family protein [Burkholderiales bacterium]|nr:tripartite tricarboxylate transporter TctB family protein [Burkholderiales bacterium]